jgi:hypothetical protein
LIFFKKVDIVKRLISILVFNIQLGTDSLGLNVFSAGCRRSQYTQRLTVEYPDDFHIVHDKPTLFRNNHSCPHYSIKSTLNFDEPNLQWISVFKCRAISFSDSFGC